MTVSSIELNLISNININMKMNTSEKERESSPTLSEAERLDEVEPLRHLLSIDDVDDEKKNIQTDPQTQTETEEHVSILPCQRHTIRDQVYMVRYSNQPKLEPQTILIEESSDKIVQGFASSLDTPASDSDPDPDLQHYEIILNCDQSKGCGGIIWPAAQVLGQYLASNPTLLQRWREKSNRSLQQGQKFHVLELGSGTGLVGLLVSKLAGEFHLGIQSWITDQSAMLDIMEQNLDLNPEIKGCVVAELNWGEPLPEQVPQKPDVLLLADCVYLEVAFQPLIDTMLELSTKETEILFCYQKRRKADKRFFTKLKKHFAFRDVEDDDPERSRAYRREGTQLLWVVKK